MERRKVESAALFLAIFGILLIMPPFTTLFDAHARIVNVPVKMLYLFGLWVLLIAGTAWLARRLPADDTQPTEGED